ACPSATAAPISVPCPPIAYTVSPSTAGVPRGPSPQPLSSRVPSRAAHSSLPSFTSRHNRNSLSARAPIVNSFPPTIEKPEYPKPTSLLTHNCCGPLGGHSFSRPVSVETSLRSGPRHCGHETSAPNNSGGHNNITKHPREQRRSNMRRFLSGVRFDCW